MKHLYLILALASLLACNSERAQLDKIQIELKLHRFEEQLFALQPSTLAQQVEQLEAEHPVFFPLFTAGILHIGKPGSEGFEQSLLQFVSDSLVRKGYEDAQPLFADHEALRHKLTLAFKRYRLHFPHDSIPQVYTFVSGFNQSIMIADNILGVGLDKYIGTGYPPYTQMGFYKYMQRNMVPGRVPIELLQAQAIAKYPDRSTDLLGRMIWEGKILYFAKRMLPTEPDTLMFGFSKAQLLSCLNNEGYMWDYLVQNKLLFNTQARVIREFTEEAPFTSKFSQEAPGKAANWIGYRIVDSYMRRNKHVTLPELMAEQNVVRLLDEAKYSPK